VFASGRKHCKSRVFSAPGAGSRFVAPARRRRCGANIPPHVITRQFCGASVAVPADLSDAQARAAVVASDAYAQRASPARLERLPALTGFQQVVPVVFGVIFTLFSGIILLGFFGLECGCGWDGLLRRNRAVPVHGRGDFNGALYDRISEDDAGVLFSRMEFALDFDHVRVGNV
jgi:hypothetical protein